MRVGQIERKCRAILANTDDFKDISFLIENFRHLRDGGNNSIYTFDVQKSESPTHNLIVKCYPFPTISGHNRMHSEWTFLKHSHSVLGDLVPEPIAQDPEANMSIFSRLDGQPINNSSITQDMVDQYLDFLKKINRKDITNDHANYVQDISTASDSSINSIHFLTSISAKIDQLNENSDQSPEFANVVENMQEVYAKLRSKIDRLFKQRAEFHLMLPKAAQILSPSDVGFHNCLQRKDGTLQFLDFEYAGWDDVSKLFADFFLTPQAPIPFCYFQATKLKLLDLIPNEYRADAEIRMEVFYPMYSLKWCCIRLNPFIKEWVAAREFYNDEIKLSELKASRLGAAKEELKKLEQNYN